MSEPPVRLRWPVVLVGCVLLLAAGAGGAYFFINRTSSTSAPAAPLDVAATAVSSPAPLPAPGEPLPDVVLTLTSEGVTGAGIVVGAVSTGTVSSRVTIAGTVEANTGQQVAVTAPAAGRVTSVSAEPGAQVERGQLLAQISSPDLALAQTRFLSTQASATAAQQQLQRIEKLMGVGAVSRQDLERARGDYTAASTELDAARAQLTLLGVSPESLAVLTAKGEVAAVTVTAPAQGTVVQRDAVPGQSVDTAARLFTIADLSSVWIVGDVNEKDLSHVRLGSPATITTAALPDISLNGIVNYIDPQVNSVTHTARIRVDAPNPRGELHLGAVAELQIGDDGSVPAVLVPREAIQNFGDRQVIYLANAGEPGRFVEHEVRLGEIVGDQIVVIAGVKPGDQIVVKGSAFLRSERERLGLRAAPR